MLFRSLCVTLLVASFAIVATSSVSLAAPSARVSGGGIVAGDLGTTSQLGFTASASGGSFLCLMAGRSGGFPFGPWASVSQMLVVGPVEPGTLTTSASGESAFEGTATIHVVGRTASGEILTATLPDMRFISRQQAGGAASAWHELEVIGVGTFGPAPLSAGRIVQRD